MNINLEAEKKDIAMAEAAKAGVPLKEVEDKEEEDQDQGDDKTDEEIEAMSDEEFAADISRLLGLDDMSREELWKLALEGGKMVNPVTGEFDPNAYKEQDRRVLAEMMASFPGKKETVKSGS